MGMIGGVAEVTPNHHSRVIEQRTSFFLDHIEGRKELVEMPDYVFLNPAGLSRIGPGTTMLGYSMLRTELICLFGSPTFLRRPASKRKS